MISFAGLKDVDLDLLLRITSFLSTVEWGVVRSSAVRASANSSRASDAIFFGLKSFVWISYHCDRAIRPWHLEFHISVVWYSMEPCEFFTPQ